VEREGHIAVAISTVLTPELLQEGLARELVHHVQNTRKTADFEIDDRIVLRVTGPVEVVDMLAVHGEWVKKETLALDLEVVDASADTAPAPLASGAHTEKVKVNGMPVTIEVAKA
jgi:isoleucyl-tRNA synthetase